MLVEGVWRLATGHHFPDKFVPANNICSPLRPVRPIESISIKFCVGPRCPHVADCDRLFAEKSIVMKGVRTSERSAVTCTRVLQLSEAHKATSNERTGAYPASFVGFPLAVVQPHADAEVMSTRTNEAVVSCLWSTRVQVTALLPMALVSSGTLFLERANPISPTLRPVERMATASRCSS